MEILLDTLKWSAVVGAAALVLTALKPLLDKRYSPKWRYSVWFLLAVMLLLAPVQWERLLPQVEAPAPAVVIEVPRLVRETPPAQVQTPAAPLPAGTPSAAAPVTPKRTWDPGQVLTALWLVGAALFLLYHLAGTLFLQRQARRWSRLPSEDTLRVYGQVRREMGLCGVPPVRVSPQVDSPMLTGLLRPCLLLPGEDFSERELRFILRHELTHWRRHDLWYKLVMLAANAVHWFNPLAYLMSREASRDIELTCDALVVSGADAEARRAYSETLLASIHRQSALGRSALSTHFYGGAEVMKERFRNILGKQGRRWGGIVLALTLLVTVVTACAVGISQAEGPEALSREELDEWQEKLTGSGEQDLYLCRMYTDPAYVPSDELLESFRSPGTVSLGSPPPDFTVVSGTADGDTVTLELEGWFTSNLTTATLTLVDGKPVSLTNPLYTAVEKMAWDFVNASSMAGQGVEIAERCIPNIYCSESFELEGKTWYVWEFEYWLKPADIGQVTLAGGMDERNGWVSDFYSAPILIVSGDSDGSYILEETAAQYTKEDGFSWEDYAYAHVILGMDLSPVLNGWPEINSAFIESLKNGHETWAMDWQDVALSYASQFLGTSQPSGSGFSVLYQAEAESVDYDESMVVQADYDGTLQLLLTHVVYDDVSFWQVNGVLWRGAEPDVPETPADPEDSGTPDDIPNDPLDYETQPGELTAEELAAFTAWFNPGEERDQDADARNGLLRFPYDDFAGISDYLEILFYDAGEGVTDEAERAALEERMNAPIETDCFKLTRDGIRSFFQWNFAEEISQEEMDRMIAENLSLPNLPDYDAFYLIHGDTMMQVYAFDRGVREADGTVKLYYTTDLWVYTDNGEFDILWDQPMCVTMGLTRNETWGVISNTMVSE